MNRAPINISTFCAAVCIMAPATTIRAPMKMVFFRPNPSQRYGVKGRAPRDPMFWMAPSRPSFEPVGFPKASSHWSINCKPSRRVCRVRENVRRKCRMTTYSSYFRRIHLRSK